MSKVRECIDENLQFEDLAIWDKLPLPEGYIPFGAKFRDEMCGEEIYTPFALPIRLLKPSLESEANVYTVRKNGATFDYDLSEHRVIAAYVDKIQPHTVTKASDGDSKAFFLVLGLDRTEPDNYRVVSSGPYRFPDGHDYIIGATYYLGEDGEPTTTVTTQKLFDVIDQTRIDVKIQEV